MLALALCALVAAVPATTVAEWVEQLGPPSKPAYVSNAARSPDEPLMLYWMQVAASPLGVGPKLSGTLVANFRAESEFSRSPLSDLTFLAVATTAQAAALLRQVRARDWVVAERPVQRGAGRFIELALSMEDGRRGTLTLRRGSADRPTVADGRPAPNLWLHMKAGSRGP